jgi:hypothetical protein
MSLDALPEELILKIGNLLSSDRDFSAFTLTNLRTFTIFAGANYIWRKRLDQADLVASEVLRQHRADSGPLTCPEKEAFYLRSKVERNYRRNRYKMTDLYKADESCISETHQPHHVSYQDLFVYVHYIASKRSWQVVWFDPNLSNKIQMGFFTKQLRYALHYSINQGT